MDSLPPAMQDVGAAGANAVGSHGDRLQAGTAEAVDGDAGGRDRQTGAQRRHAGHVAAGLGFGHGAAEDHVFDVFFGNLRISGEQRADHGGGEIVGPRVAERAAGCLSDGGAEAIDDDCFRHGLGHSDKLQIQCRTRGLRCSQ